MDMAQEIAYWAASELGFGYDTLHVHHTAWVLSRMHLHFDSFPKWREDTCLQTWHKGADGLFYLRDFDLRNAAGESIIQGTSSWVVIDEQTRRIVRPEDLQNLLFVEKVDDAIATPAPKIQLPREAQPELAGEHTVAYSDLDLLGHTNNVRYVVWAMDCLPLEDAEKPLKDLYINFNKETTHGQKVELFRLKEGDAWYIEGRVEGKACFVVKLEY
jgi:acyl-ACP thioesterase